MLLRARATLVLFGDLLMVALDAAFIAVLLGYLLFMVVLIALGVSMWRPAAPSRLAEKSRPRARLRLPVRDSPGSRTVGGSPAVVARRPR